MRRRDNDNKKAQGRKERAKLRGNVLGEVNIRKRVFLPEQFGWKRLINHLLFALRASASLAAVHDL